MPVTQRFWDRIANRYDNTSDRLNAYRDLRLAHMQGLLSADARVPRSDGGSSPASRRARRA